MGYSQTKGGAFDPLFRRLVTIDSPRLLWSVFLIACAVGFLPMLYVANWNPLLIIEDSLVSGRRWSGMFSRGRYGGFRDAFLELHAR